MAIRIPADVLPAREKRLTLIRAIQLLYKHFVDAGDNGHSVRDDVKETLKAKRATYAESDLAVAAVRSGSSKSKVDPRKLYELVKGRKLTAEAFLECVTVSKTPLAKHLAGDVIDSLSTIGPASDPWLEIELREGVQLDLDQLAEQLTGALAALAPIKS
jgi:hypothetical protein